MLELFMNEMTFGSVCSGVECASIALLPLGWRCVFVSEVEPFPCAVLQQRFDATPPIHPLDPNEQGIKSQDRQERLSWLKIINKMPQIGTLPNEGDFRKIGKKYEGRIKCLIGGTPCQSFSVAGKREGLAGVSGLALDFIRLAYESKAKWIIWENVPGVLSSNDGRDFSAFLSGLTGSGIIAPQEGWGNAGFVPNGRRDRYGVAWRILDAQYTRTPNFPYAVPQRRRRIFLVGYFGDWRRAAQVLFEPESLSGYPTPCRKTRERITQDIKDCIDRASGYCKSSGKPCVYASKNHDINRINDGTSNSVLNKDVICRETQQGHAVSLENVCPTITAMCGTSGNNQPFFVKKSDICYNITTCDANGTRKDRPNGGLYVNKTDISNTISTNPPSTETVVVNKSPVFWDGGDVAHTITTRTDSQRMPDKDNFQAVIEQQVFSFDSKSSNSMKSSNPNSGCHKTNVAKTLDTSVPEPSKNQGGMAIVETVKCFPSAGFGQREENNVASTVLTDHDNRVTSDNAAFICYPINSMILNKELKEGDRQTTGIGDEKDPCPTISTNHHHVVSVIAIDGDKIGKNERKGGSGFGINEDQVMYTQTVKDVHAVAYNEENYMVDMRQMDSFQTSVSPTLTSSDYKDGKAILGNKATVRRLMPIETERLMGLPDNHTKITFNGTNEENCSDSPRYKACGNGFCTNCIEWIGRRIDLVEKDINNEHCYEV